MKNCGGEWGPYITLNTTLSTVFIASYGLIIERLFHTSFICLAALCYANMPFKIAALKFQVYTNHTCSQSEKSEIKRTTRALTWPQIGHPSTSHRGFPPNKCCLPKCLKLKIHQSFEWRDTREKNSQFWNGFCNFLNLLLRVTNFQCAILVAF